MSVRVHLSLLLFLACLSHLIFPAESVKGAGRKEKKQKSNFPIKGRSFITQNRARCSWVARGEDTYNLTVTCKPENGAEFGCSYTGRPASCRAYVDEPKTFWAQMTKSVRKQRKLCDPRSVLKAKMCKGASQEAHFQLSEPAQEQIPMREKTPKMEKDVRTNASTPGAKRKCAQNSDHSKTAEEKCGETWASLCRFLFTLVQNGDC